MKATPSQQLAILKVAKLDQRVVSLNHKASTLSELAELTNTTVKFNNARDFRIAAETELKDVKRELARAEGDVEQIVSRITRDEARLIGGTIAAKDLEKLQHEVGTLGIRRTELEEIELEIMMRVDEVNERIIDLQKQEIELKLIIDDLEIRKENAMASINNELEVIAEDRNLTVQALEKTLVDLYDRIRKDGVGAAALVGATCLGCNLSINRVELKRISELAEDEVVRCEECRCILVRGA